MSPIKHAAISGVVSISFLAVTSSWLGSWACFLSGIFIDIDHIFDFWLDKKKFLFSYKDLFNFGTRERAGRLILIFHSYELLAVFWIAIFLFHLNAVCLGIAWGATTHLLSDQWANPIKPTGYFFYYRFKWGFAKKYILKRKFYQQMV